MARNEQLIRQHKLMQLLEESRFGRTIEELRDDLVVDLGLTTLHTRTVKRDLEALIAAGFDIQQDSAERGKIYKFGRNAPTVHQIAFSGSEMIALSIGRDLLIPLAGTQYWQGIETFWNKVQEAIPEGVYEHYQRYRKTLHVIGTPAKDYAGQSGMLSTINRAILDHRVVEIEYQAVGQEPKRRRIEPYGVAMHDNSIYVVAAAQEVEDPEQRMRNWKLDRFRRVKISDDYFKPDARVDLTKILGRGVGIFSGRDATEVTIRLGKRAAEYVREDPWHPDQTLIAQGDEFWRLTVPATHPRELLPKVLALGADAEVIGPDAYRAAVADAVTAMAGRYRP